jgi:hypothetical protein
VSLLPRVLDNRIGDDGVKVLADALEINTAVVSMELNGEKEARNACNLGSLRRPLNSKGNPINQGSESYLMLRRCSARNTVCIFLKNHV